MAHTTTDAHGHSHAHAHAHGHAAGHEGHGHGFAHVMAVPMLLAVFVALLGLTFLTTWVSANVPLGEYELVVSMGLATIKAGLVIMFFMHMIHDKPLNAAIIAFSLVFVALFIGFTLLDRSAYQDQIIERTYDEVQEERALSGAG